MIKSIKLRIYPNKTQLKIINDTLYACHFVKNKFLEYNKNNHDKDKEFTSAYDFSKIINKLKKEDAKYSWLQGISSKAIQDAILAKEKAYLDFFNHNKGFPKFKSRKRINRESYYFINENHNYYITKNSVVLPKLKRIRITNGNLLPDESTIRSRRVIRHYDKYYALFIYDDEYNDNKDIIKRNIKVGIDLGIKEYAIIYDGTDFCHIKHFKDLATYKRYYDRIKELQKIISKKVEYNYGRNLNEYLDKYHKEPSEIKKNEMRGEAYNTYNIRKIFKKISKNRVKLANIVDDFIKQLVNYLTARIKPKKINIEDLDVSSMLENDESRRLHGLTQESSFYKFKVHLIKKCKEYGIRIRLVNTFYPSTKLCSKCGKKNKDIELEDRIFTCKKCGMTMDRDENAAINIYNCRRKYYKEEIA